MKYYVVADVHGYYTELLKALTDAGWFLEQGPKKLIVCGDMMDRGLEAKKMQEFMMDLLAKDQLIFIRGNHEDLMLCIPRVHTDAKSKQQANSLSLPGQDNPNEKYEFCSTYSEINATFLLIL